METNPTSTNNLTENRFRVTLILLRLSGVSICLESPSRLNWMYNSVVMTCSYATFFAMIMGFVVHSDNLQHAMKIFRVILSCLLVLWIYFNIRFRIVKFERLIRMTKYFTWDELPTRDPDTGRLRWAALIKSIQNVSKNVVASMQYQSMYFGFTILYAVLVCVACSQLEKLKTNLSDINQKGSTSDGSGAECDTDAEELVSAAQKRLNEYIRHHQLIIQYIRELEDTMNFTLCGSFLMQLITLCFVSFSAAMSIEDHTDLAQAAYVYGLLLGFLLVFCGLGTELSEQAESVRDAAWGCDWVGTPVPFQRSLAFIIATANKEFTLTAGKFVPVSNKTMINMMNQSASFFMFLLTMKDKNKADNGTQ